MFGIKTTKTLDKLNQRIRHYTAENDRLYKLIEEREQTIREMADDIRSMDQLIYQMSQCTSWEDMRPIFNQLQSKQEYRQREESNRIGGIMRRELLSVYTKGTK